MKRHCLSALVLTAAFLTASAWAGPDDKDLKRSIMETEPEYFRAHEFSGDIFALYARPEEGVLKDGFGGGIGMNYFFTKCIGLGLDGYWWEGPHVIHNVDAELIARYPFEKIHLAPYAFGGVGGTFNSESQFSGNLGLGVEYRFTPHIGVFTDGRYVIEDKTNNLGLVRLGVRYAF